MKESHLLYSDNSSFGNSLFKVVAYTSMILFTLFTIGPLLWLFYSSLKRHPEITKNILSFPVEPTLENYRTAWMSGGLGRALLNSLFFSITTTLLTLTLSLACGYGFAKIPCRATKWLQGVILIGLLITVHSVIVPLFVMETKIKINNTVIGVLLPYIAFRLPFAIFLSLSFIKSIPDSLLHAAYVDGANQLRIWWSIVLPVCRPIGGTIMIFTFLQTWNEFILISTLAGRELRTLPVSVANMAGGMVPNYGLQFAALVITTLPMILFYSLFSGQIMRGFVGGALKE